MIEVSANLHNIFNARKGRHKKTGQVRFFYVSKRINIQFMTLRHPGFQRYLLQ